MSSYRFVEQIDDRLRSDLMELYRHEWWTNQRREEDVARMLQHTDLVVGVCADDDEAFRHFPGGSSAGVGVPYRRNVAHHRDLESHIVIPETPEYGFYRDQDGPTR